MLRRIFILLSIICYTTIAAFASPDNETSEGSCNHKHADLDGLSYGFIENQGQWEGDFLYKAYIPDGFFYLERNGFTYSFYDGEAMNRLKHFEYGKSYLPCHAVKIRFLGCNESPEISHQYSSSTYFNYFHGNDRSKWKSNVKAYGLIIYKNIYDQIDLEIFSSEGTIKFNFIVNPGGNPEEIRVRYEGASDLELVDGHLHVQTSVNEFMEYIPKVYQLDDEDEIKLECRYYLAGNVLSYGFPAGFDYAKPFIIDPVVIFSTFSGSWADNFGYTATYDDSGYAYSGGTVFFDSFPVTPGAFQRKWGGGVPGNPSSGDDRDIGILKYSPDGSQLVYATYLGGRGNEDPHSMVVNSKYELLIFGNTSSDNFPIGNKFYDSSYNDSIDIILAKLSQDGRVLEASTYIGGISEDGVNGYFNLSINYCNRCRLGYNYGDTYRGEVIVDDDDNVYVATTTKSDNFPIVGNVFQKSFGGGRQDACVLKLNSDLSSILKSSFIGGNDDDAGYALAINASNEIYVCGGTQSSNLPMTGGKFLNSYQGGVADGFLYYISKDFDTLLSSTFMGTDMYDQIYFVQTDRFGYPYVTGQTRSDSFFKKNVKYTQYKNKGRQFITKFNKGLDSIIYSTVFGSGNHYPDLSPSAFLVDHCERVYLSGWGGVTNWVNCYNRGETYGLPTSSGAPQTTTDGSDFYVAVFAKNIDTLLYATYWGDPISNDHVDGGTSRFDKNSIIYQAVCAGCGQGANSMFPTTSGAWSTVNKGHRPKNSAGIYTADGCNNAIFKIDLDIPDLKADFVADTIFCINDYTHIVNTSYGAESYIWDFGDGDTSHVDEPVHFYGDTGIYKVTLVAINLSSCDQYDTVTKNVVVYDMTESDFSYQTLDCTNHFQFTGLSRYAQEFYWDFDDSTYSSDKSPKHLFTDTGSYTVTLIVDSGTVCEHRTVKNIYVPAFPVSGFDFTIDTCEGKAIFIDSSENNTEILWLFGDGDSSDQSSPVHFYKTVDTFQIIQIAEPYTVCADTSYNELIIITPKAEILTDIDSCTFEVKFKNPSSYVKDVSIWYVGNTDVISNKDSFVYEYDTAGTYEITLIANSGTLCSTTVKKTIELPKLPVVDFGYERRTCHPYISFYNSSQYTNTYLWDFGNQQSSVKEDPDSVYYDSAGNYFVTLYGISPYGCADTITDTIYIDHIAIADFLVDKTMCETTVEFINNSSQPGSYYWDFGNGLTSNDEVPDPVTYDTIGTYEVWLVVTDGPCSDTMMETLDINEPPDIDFVFTTEKCFPVVSFKGSAEGVIDEKYLWEFGDSNNSYVRDIVYEYASPGNYTVKFTINYDTICKATVEKEIEALGYVDEPEVPNIFTPNNDGINDVFHISGLNFDCDVYELLIYNRWGQLVFESEKEHLDWDGKTHGKLVSEGTYYYIFKSSRLNQAGTITVVY